MRIADLAQKPQVFVLHLGRIDLADQVAVAQEPAFGRGRRKVGKGGLVEVQTGVNQQQCVAAVFCDGRELAGDARNAAHVLGRVHDTPFAERACERAAAIGFHNPQTRPRHQSGGIGRGQIVKRCRVARRCLDPCSAIVHSYAADMAQGRGIAAHKRDDLGHGHLTLADYQHVGLDHPGKRRVRQHVLPRRRPSEYRKAARVFGLERAVDRHQIGQGPHIGRKPDHIGIERSDLGDDRVQLHIGAVPDPQVQIVLSRGPHRCRDLIEPKVRDERRQSLVPCGIPSDQSDLAPRTERCFCRHLNDHQKVPDEPLCCLETLSRCRRMLRMSSFDHCAFDVIAIVTGSNFTFHSGRDRSSSASGRTRQ